MDEAREKELVMDIEESFDDIELLGWEYLDGTEVGENMDEDEYHYICEKYTTKVYLVLKGN